MKHRGILGGFASAWLLGVGSVGVGSAWSQEVNLAAAELSGSSGVIDDAGGIEGLTMSIAGSGTLTRFFSGWLGVNSAGDSGFFSPQLVNLANDEWISFSFNEDVLLLGVEAENVATFFPFGFLERGEVAQIESAAFGSLTGGDVDGFGVEVSGGVVTWHGTLLSGAGLSFPGGVFLPAGVSVTFSEGATLPGAPTPSNGVGIGAVTIAPVPEPGLVEMLSVGIGALLILRRRR